MRCGPVTHLLLSNSILFRELAHHHHHHCHQHTLCSTCNTHLYIDGTSETKDRWASVKSPLFLPLSLSLSLSLSLAVREASESYLRWGHSSWDDRCKPRYLWNSRIPLFNSLASGWLHWSSLHPTLIQGINYTDIWTFPLSAWALPLPLFLSLSLSHRAHNYHKCHCHFHTA